MRELRPRFHLTTATGWLNDPNALVHRDGLYHAFFQHNPAATTWGDINWGHAVSEDLVRWRQLPLALRPTPGGPDADGCWSGSFVDDDGVPTLVYSGFVAPSEIGARSVCLARGDEGMLHWAADPRSPVLDGPPAGLDVVAFRDPYLWRDEEGWSLILGTGLAGEGPAILRYRSVDLLDWEYAGIVCAGDEGQAWECPQLFPLGERHVLLVSQWDDRRRPQTEHALAIVGEYADGRFVAESTVRFDHGPDCYAPATMLDASGRRLALGWAWEARDAQATATQGWAGALTLPRVLTLGDDGTLGVEPVPEVESLRCARESLDPQRLASEQGLRLGTEGDAVELALTVRPSADAVLELEVCAAPGEAEVTTIRFSRASGRLELDRTRSSLHPGTTRDRHGGTLALRDDEPLELRVFVDRSIVEVYANGRFTLTGRVYPTLEDSTRLGLVLQAGEATIDRLEAWLLTP